MTHVSGGDLSRLLTIVHAAHAATSVEQLVDVALAEVPRLVRCDLVAWNEIDLVTGELTGRGAPAELAASVFPQVQARLASHPLVAHFGSGPTLRVTRISDVVGRRDWHRNPLYAEVFAPLRLEHQVGVPLLATPQTLSALALSRGGSDFSARDVAVLDALGPMLAEVERGLLWRDALEAEIAAGHRTEVALVASDGAVVARTTDAPRARSLPRRLHLVRVQEPNAPFGLSEQQLAALEAVSTGATVAAAARSLGISPRTLDKHLERAYAKLGVNNRVAALGRLRESGAPAP